MADSIIPGFPLQDSLRFWIPQALLAGRTPVLSAAGIARQDAVADPSGRTIAQLITYSELSADTEYTLTLTGPGAQPTNADTPRCTARTLPDKILPGSEFAFSFASCFWAAGDHGMIHKAYPPVANKEAFDPIRFRLLLGDQIYLDYPSPLTLWNASQYPPLVAPKPAGQYAVQWADPNFTDFLASTPTACLADDHEFWNDYPHANLHEPWSFHAHGSQLDREAQQCFKAYQASLNPNGQLSFTFTVYPFSFFIVDTRLGRSRYDIRGAHFCDPAIMVTVCAWLRNLQGPGVLALGGLLVDEPPTWIARVTHTFGDTPLPMYVSDFSRIWEALASAPHDVIVLAGDIHSGKLGYVRIPRGSSAHSVYEAISSPLCVLETAPGKPEDGISKFDATGNKGDGKMLEYHRLDPKTIGGNHFAVVRLRNAVPVPEFSIAYHSANREVLWDSLSAGLHLTLQ